MHGFPFDLADALVVLVAAGVVAPLLHRFRVSPVIAFLLMGLVVGPYGLARFAEAAPWLSYVTISNVEGATAFAEIGVVLLLFVIGLEIPVARLWAMRKLVFGLGGIQVAVSAILIGAIAYAFGNAPGAAFVLGAAFALSSTAIVLQLLSEKGRLSSVVGRASLGILLLQDLAVVPILLFVDIIGGESVDPAWLALLKAGGVAIAVIGAIMVAGRLGARPFLKFAAATRAPELFMGAVLLLVVATAAATAAAHLSLALGAFLAGLLLADTEYRHDIEVTIAPFKGLMLGLFFMSVAMTVDLGQALAQPHLLVLALIGLMAIKATVIIATARVLGLSWATAAETALLLGGAGEFAFVIVGLAATLGVVDGPTAQFMVLLAGASMMLTPLMAALARRLGKRLEAQGLGGDPAADDDLTEHVVIVGYGRVGQLLSDVLDSVDTPWLAVEADADLVAKARADGKGVYFGDASKAEILHRLAAERASAIVVTMDSATATEAVVRAVAGEWPHAHLVARARDAAHARALLALGAHAVTPETLEASLDLAASVLRGIGVPDESATAIVEARRRAFMAVLKDEAAHAG